MEIPRDGHQTPRLSGLLPPTETCWYQHLQRRAAAASTNSYPSVILTVTDFLLLGNIFTLAKIDLSEAKTEKSEAQGSTENKFILSSRDSLISKQASPRDETAARLSARQRKHVRHVAGNCERPSEDAAHFSRHHPPTATDCCGFDAAESTPGLRGVGRTTLKHTETGSGSKTARCFN